MADTAWIGLDVGGTNIKAGVVDTNGHVHYQHTIPTDTSSDRMIVKQLIGLCRELTCKASGTHNLQAIGVAIPGSVDVKQGIAVGAANLPWDHTPVASALAAETGLPVSVQNDTNAGALAESRFGAGKSIASFFYMAIGTGIGGGIFIDGKLLGQDTGKGSGEIGHIVIDPQGPRCPCGQTGCLEVLAAAPAIARLGRKLASEMKHGILWQWVESGRSIDARLVFEAAASADQAANRALTRTGEYLAIGLIAVHRLLAPDLSIIGGGVAAAGDLLIDAINKGLETLGAGHIPVVVSLLKQTGVVGAAAVAMDREVKP